MALFAIALSIYTCKYVKAESVVEDEASTMSKQKTSGDKFINSETEYKSGLGDIWQIMKAYAGAKRAAPAPTVQVPVVPLTKSQLIAESHDAIYRLGHSTLLMRIDGEFILLDPVFSERASPVQWAGPKRFHQSPISIEELPQIKAVIISHDHYDHLDKAAIKALDEKVAHFVTPLKVGDHMIDWGIDAAKVTQLAWWQDIELGSLKLTATPTQHFSGRGLLDRDHTLWASWVIQGQQHRIFFSGDSGYFGGFKQIGERFGPFDLTLVETGAYNELWSDIHMLPEQSLQAHIDLQGKTMLPIHNGTFDLALHDWFEPLEKISQLAQAHNVELVTPRFGEEVVIGEASSTHAWWKPMLSAETETASNGAIKPVANNI
ncbi:hydrolase [Shewanella sp. WXL01]|uniref:Hydrolase n=2 Tax=Shewanellaceae TaxID=267890 RepID=A0A411PMX9_9GAMM|nr:hydrolase [Shewanella sp. WXL01]QBF84856.1 hydrolase [Shewanella maritima]